MPAKGPTAPGRRAAAAGVMAAAAESPVAMGAAVYEPPVEVAKKNQSHILLPNQLNYNSVDICYL